MCHICVKGNRFEQNDLFREVYLVFREINSRSLILDVIEEKVFTNLDEI